MVVGICRLSLHFGGSQSLKDKRQGLRRLIDRTRAKFNAAVAEVGGQDSWQRAVVGLVVVGNDGAHVRSMLDTICAFTEQLYVAQILDRELELLHYGEDAPFQRPRSREHADG
ncbi:MAG: DUF503 domain-containing protein [Proteobacteria bacterium]|jgi:uncharacterized protein YlxP (DUF503 family)|nr:DUF503 domain-containing protein [Pseudomonadota bacterium]